MKLVQLNTEEAFNAALDEAMRDDWEKFTSHDKQVVIHLKAGDSREYLFESDEAQAEFLEYLFK